MKGIKIMIFGIALMLFGGFIFNGCGQFAIMVAALTVEIIGLLYTE